MSAKGGTVLIVAPFWRHAPHVGIHRVERFVRWLHESGVRIVLARAGGTENVTATEREIPTPPLRDPIRLYRDPDGPRAPVWRRGRSRLRRSATLALFVRMPRSWGPAAPATTRRCSRARARSRVGSSRRVRPSRSTWPREPGAPPEGQVAGGSARRLAGRTQQALPQTAAAPPVAPGPNGSPKPGPGGPCAGNLPGLAPAARPVRPGWVEGPRADERLSGAPPPARWRAARRHLG